MNSRTCKELQSPPCLRSAKPRCRAGPHPLRPGRLVPAVRSTLRRRARTRVQRPCRNSPREHRSPRCLRPPQAQNRIESSYPCRGRRVPAARSTAGRPPARSVSLARRPGEVLVGAGCRNAVSALAAPRSPPSRETGTRMQSVPVRRQENVLRSIIRVCSYRPMRKACECT